MPNLPPETTPIAAHYTNEELESGIVEYQTNTMPKNETGKVLDLEFYELIVKLIGMQYWHIALTIQDLEFLTVLPIERFLNPDKERWYHYFDYINGFKRESEYKCWYSNKRRNEFVAMRSKWENAIVAFRQEYHDLEKMAAMSREEHREYCRKLYETLLQ